MLFKTEGMIDERRVAMQTCVDAIPQKLKNEQHGLCDQELTLDALTVTPKQKVGKKSPSLELGPCECYEVHGNLWVQIYAKNINKLFVPKC